MVLPIVAYEYESWSLKKAECGRIVAFKLWCSRRLLRVTWTARTPNQSLLIAINPQYSLETLVAELRYFVHLMQKADSLEKKPDAGKDKGKRRRGWQSIRWLDSITVSIKKNLSKLQETVEDRGS